VACGSEAYCPGICSSATVNIEIRSRAGSAITGIGWTRVRKIDRSPAPRRQSSYLS
jgi:hypothetical protein